MGIISWIVLGAVAGWITNLIMGGKEGVVATIVLGIVGALVGGFVAGTVLGVADVTGFNISSVIVAVIGAVIVVVIYRAVARASGDDLSPVPYPGVSALVINTLRLSSRGLGTQQQRSVLDWYLEVG